MFHPTFDEFERACRAKEIALVEIIYKQTQTRAGSIKVVFSLGWQVTRFSSYVRRPFSPRRTGEYRKRMISACPLHQGVRKSVWDPETSRERIGGWGGPETVWALLCVAERPQGQTESGGIVLADICWSPSAQRRCDPAGRCAYRPSVTS